MLREDLPEDLPVVFISSVAQTGLTELKDVLWRALNSESNKMTAISQNETLVHRDKDFSFMHDDEDDLDLSVDEEEADDEELIEEEWDDDVSDA